MHEPGPDHPFKHHPLSIDLNRRWRAQKKRTQSLKELTLAASADVNREQLHEHFDAWLLTCRRDGELLFDTFVEKVLDETLPTCKLKRNDENHWKGFKEIFSADWPLFLSKDKKMVESEDCPPPHIGLSFEQTDKDAPWQVVCSVYFKGEKTWTSREGVWEKWGFDGEALSVALKRKYDEQWYAIAAAPIPTTDKEWPKVVEQISRESAKRLKEVAKALFLG